MKHKTFSIMLAMLISVVACGASAHDFEVNGIYYKIINANLATVAVSYGGVRQTHIPTNTLAMS